ncbi:hypothetical protein GCM10022236_41110 [Microlunatus ginsengisoli]|uniref:Uncharacterized protein n=2 Tax=Microlunatus ginsengisoli TaxID=363863 RepID=A0ABP7AKM2_9ACTN
MHETLTLILSGCQSEATTPHPELEIPMKRSPKLVAVLGLSSVLLIGIASSGVAAPNTTAEEMGR